MTKISGAAAQEPIVHWTDSVGQEEMRAGRIAPIVAAVIGATLILAAAVFRLYVAPRTLWLKPGERTSMTNLGEMTLTFDPWTARPADPPHVLSFKAVTTTATSSGPDGTIAASVVQESQAAASVNATAEELYYLDPATTASVDAPIGWSLVPENKVERGSVYSVGLPPGFDPDRSYPYYQSATMTDYELVPTGRAEVEGLETVTFEGTYRGPMNPVMEADFVENFGLLVEFKPDELFTIIRIQAGVDLAAPLRQALPLLDPASGEMVQRVLTEPVDVRYEVDGETTMDIERVTGVPVRTSRWVAHLTAFPDMTHFETAAEALRDSTDPAVVAASEALEQFIATEGRVLIYDIDAPTTPESTTVMAERVKTIIGEHKLFGVWVPVVLLVVGLVLLVFAFDLRGRRGVGDGTPDAGGGEGAEPEGFDAYDDDDPDAEAAATSA